MALDTPLDVRPWLSTRCSRATTGRTAAWQTSPPTSRGSAGDHLSPVGALGLYGIFNVGGHRGRAHVQLPDGRYDDLVSGERLRVRNGWLTMPGPAVILEFADHFEATLWRSSLLDVFLQVEAEEA